MKLARKLLSALRLILALSLISLDFSRAAAQSQRSGAPDAARSVTAFSPATNSIDSSRIYAAMAAQLDATSSLLNQPESLAKYLFSKYKESTISDSPVTYHIGTNKTPDELVTGQMLLEAFADPDGLQQIRRRLEQIQTPENQALVSNIAAELDRQASALHKSPETFKKFNDAFYSLNAAFEITRDFQQPEFEKTAAQLEALYSGRQAAAQTPPAVAADVLGEERPRFTPQQIERVQKKERALEAAVRDAAGSLMAAGSFQVRVDGSTSRLTHTEKHPDYDVMVKVDGKQMPQGLAAFMDKNLDALKAALVDAVKARAADLFSGTNIRVQVKGPNPVSDPLTKKTWEGVYLLGVKMYGPNKKLLWDADVAFTSRDDFATAYPEYFASQMEQTARLGGGGSAGDELKERLLSDIRLTKRLFKEGIEAYKSYHGGPSGVGIEQLIMQSGKVSDADKGQTILEPGGFDRLMERILRIAFDETGRLRGVEEGRRLWTVHNPFMAPQNFLDFLSPETWARLAYAARKYAEAQVTGRPITLKELRDSIATAQPPLSREIEEKSEGAPADTSSGYGISQITMDLLKKFFTQGPSPEERGDAFLYAEGAKTLPPGLEESWKELPPPAPVTVPEGGWKGLGRFYRRDGKAFIRLPPSVYPRTLMKPNRVPEQLARGILTDTIVEVVIDRPGMDDIADTGAIDSSNSILSVRPVGAYPANMLVGRAVQRGPALVFDALFHEDRRAKATYEPLSIEGGVNAANGDIIQAFIKPVKGGFVAVPLVNLGRNILPEVAAREIAFRYGARGYFEQAVIEQAETIAKTLDPAKEFKKLKESGARLREVPCKQFITVDPAGAADLDDAFCIEKHPDGSYTWYLATADVARYVRPGTPAFKAAMRIANTYYTLDKDGVPAYPMNHPVISQAVASLLADKDSLAVVTEMRFSPEGKPLDTQPDIALGLIRVQGRYAYDQVVDFWGDKPGHGIGHPEQITLARELAAKLHERDKSRGKLIFSFDHVGYRQRPDGYWEAAMEKESPEAKEAHRLIEELKVYGNLQIEALLRAITDQYQVPHIQRTHPHQPKQDEKFRKKLTKLGVVWKPEQTLEEFIADVQSRGNISPEKKEVIQNLALRTRSQAEYVLIDKDGHEGLALEAGSYGHDSAPIRRFSDMYNLALVQAYLEGSDPREVYAVILRDVQALGFPSIEEYMMHLFARQQAGKTIKYETEDFMSLYELSKPEYKGRVLRGYVKAVEPGEFHEPAVTIQLRGVPATVKIRGPRTDAFSLLDEVEVTIRGADLAELRLDAKIKNLTSTELDSK